MTDLKTLKLRIKSVKKTEKITKAMKMVAASKLRKARIAAEDCRDGYNKLLESYHNIMATSEEVPQEYLVKKDKKKHLLVILTTDRGLCGGLNSNITKFSLKRIAELEASGFAVELAIYGKKSYEQLKAKSKAKIAFNRQNALGETFNSEDSAKCIDEIFSYIDENEIADASLISTKFVSAIAQEVIEEPLLIAEHEASDSVSDNISFEPDRLEFLKEFIALKLSSQFFHAAIEFYACEQGSRMTAMDNAVKNCQELAKKLSLQYNRTRQAKITTELIEIISASESI